MIYWSNLYFIEANSPIIEQIIIFHDHSIIIIFSILIFLLISIYKIFSNKILNLFLIENQNIEMIWTIIPIVLLLFIAAPRLRLLYLIEEIFEPNLTLKILGHQWFWSYEYSEFSLEFDSFIENQKENLNNFRLLETDNYVSIPLNSLCRILVSSVDVIHSWTIQSLGVKTDAIPGRLNQINIFSNQPGVYYGQCSEICGANHRFMPISLEIISVKNFVKS